MLWLTTGSASAFHLQVDRMRITDVRCHVLLAPNVDQSLTSSGQDSFLLVIDTDEGIQGIGETDVNPWIARACLTAPGTHTMGRSLRELLIGADASDIESLWWMCYQGSAMNGRRGAVVHTLGAIDMALWDLKGKAEGRPLFELLGGQAQARVVPYASLQPTGSDFENYRDSLVNWAMRAKEIGFRAVKIEVTMNGPYAHNGLREPYSRHTEIVAAVREAIGPEISLLVDVQYLWKDADTALETLQDWEEFDLAFVETPLWSDDLDGYGRLAEATSIPIAAGEWLATRWEFEELLDRGRIGVAQPDVGRVGGPSEAMHVAALAIERGVPLVPHCWKTGVSVAATAHFAFATKNCSLIEYLPPQLCVETLRKELADDGLRFEDGYLLPPTKAGLGVTVDWDVVHRYEVL
jgi:L-alanine-DL-glutamate epimerase-like enolase superfamily enzyme